MKSDNNQKEIKIFEAFAGIGTQRKALENIAKSKNWKVTSVGIIEWYIDAIIGYVNLHHPEIKLPKKELEIDITNLALSTDSKKLASERTLKNIKNSKAFYIKKSQEVCNNLFNISEIEYHQIPKEIDIFTYSFPCQDLSLQGKQKGMNKDSGSRSSLLWQIQRIFKGMKENWKQEDMPKYLLLENVKNIVSKIHKPELNIWIKILETFGYKSYIYVCNAAFFGSPQNRERVFILSVRNDFAEKINFQKIDLKQEHKKVPMNFFKDEIKDKKPLGKLNKYKYTDFVLTKNNIKKSSLLNYTTFNSEAHIYDPNFSGPTLTASGANSRIKIIDENNYIYSLTSSYLYRYMGMSASDYKKISKNGLISEIKLIYLAGNAISINVLEAIFKKLEF